MTPEEALELLTNVTSHLQLNRPDTLQIITALQVVQEMINNHNLVKAVDEEGSDAS